MAEFSFVDTKKHIAPDIRPGDTVRVWQKVKEKDGKTRLQSFEGLCLARKHGATAGGTFTVRKVSSGVGVEKVFPIHSPMIERVELMKRSKVRRAKLYYVREKAAKEIRRQMRRSEQLVGAEPASLEEAATSGEQEVKEAVDEKEAAPLAVVESGDGKSQKE